nr:5'-3' exoribonuclease 1 [Cryptococcus depauperatus CBS 7855]
MIIAIFTYIDHLFTKIKPRKVFFMAIDGVAPRAKMNQQRSRRFRTARDAREQRETAERNGEKLPEEKAFDSNAITPGTPFMAKLSQHLKYYIRKRISEDADWQGIKVIFSGHDVPGEGEHKIQEFIRLSKAQSDYNPNTRHCLYGLDADLIMLGLLSHDPHFCLLREEVTFGRKSKRTTELANTNFFLLHLSLMREYLDLEFSSLSSQLLFEYDLERIIDDFILMAIFVGNDFLPHLPDLHINEGALERIWGIYKEILPTIDGYLNEHGTISLPRLQVLLDKLSEFEIKRFEDDLADQVHFQGSHTKDTTTIEKARKKGRKVITREQQKILNKLRSFIQYHQKDPKSTDCLKLIDTKDKRDNAFVQELADELHLHTSWDEVDDYGQNLIICTFNIEGVSENESTDDENGNEEKESDEENEGDLAVQRVFQKWSKAAVVDSYPEDVDKSMNEILKEAMDGLKRTYYRDKLEISYDDSTQLYELAYHYIEGLQWILNYYYKGVCSWGWFYKHHYSPHCSIDLKMISDMKFNFDFGKPFTPFQQLMGVLPADSQEHVPLAYRDLMYEDTSPILDFYPRNFDLDMNGKKQDWEAVVKIPFIDQDRLLKAMSARDVRLTSEERDRNKSGVLSTQFSFDPSCEDTYPSSLSGVFPELVRCRCRASEFRLPTLGDDVELIFGLLDGVHLGASALAGFPSLQTLPHYGALGYHGVNVFQSESKNQSMIITITGKQETSKTSEIAQATIGQKAYHSWPYLQEGLVVAVSDDMFKYEMHRIGKANKIVASPLQDAGRWRRQADRVERHYSKRCGVIIGAVETMLHVRPLKGLKHLDTGALVKNYETADKEIVQAYQMSVSQVTFEDERYLEQAPPDLTIDYPVGEKVVFLGAMMYGYAAQVTAINEGKQTLDVVCAAFDNEDQENVEFMKLVAHRPSGVWYPAPVLCKRLGISALALSRITSTLLVQLEDGSRTNIGLPLKFESKGLKVLGYTKRNDRGWEYSELAAQKLGAYKQAFPEVFKHLEARGGDMVKSKTLCPSSKDPDSVIKEMKKWCKDNDVTDLETVSLFADQLEKETCEAIDKLAKNFNSYKSLQKIKKRLLRDVPRQSLLKPVQAIYRLQGQVFSIGHRVVMVHDPAAGGVPTGMKGVVVGLGMTSIDVIWDTAFMGGTTLQGRCSEYRGSSVPFWSSLNLTRRQFQVMENTGPRVVPEGTFQPQLGPRPAVQGLHYQSSVPARQPSLTSRPFAAPTHNLRNGGVQSSPQKSTIIGENGHLHYSGAAKSQKPETETTQAQNVDREDKLAKLLGGISGLSVKKTSTMIGGASTGPRHQQGATQSPVDIDTEIHRLHTEPANLHQSDISKPGIGAARGRGGVRGNHVARGRNVPRGTPVIHHNAPRGRGRPQDATGRGGPLARGRGRGRGGMPATTEA